MALLRQPGDDGLDAVRDLCAQADMALGLADLDGARSMLEQA